MKSPERMIKMLHQNYKYTLDTKQYGEERMDSHYEVMIADEKWTDDCDGFAATAAEFCIREGYDREDVRLVIGPLSNGENHMVCALNLDDKTVVMDCNKKNLVDWNRLYFKPKYYMAMNKPGEWNTLED